MKVVIASASDGEINIQQYDTDSVLSGLTRYVTEQLGLSMDELELDDDFDADDVVGAVGETTETALDYLIVT